MNKLREIVDDTIQAVAQMKQSGITHVAVTPATRDALGQPIVRRPKKANRPPAPAQSAPRPTVDFAELTARTKACTKCSELARCRKNVVFGVGDVHAELMFVGEAPGADEDEQGEPFVGRAGQLLTKIIVAMGYQRSEVYIANVLKCRPPQNRTPLPDEMNHCRPYLLEQIDAIQPKVIVALGATALRALLLETPLGITKMRGNWYTFHNTPIMPTFHPAYLLRNPPAKREVWEDMKTVLAKLGRPVPKNKV